MKFLRAAAFVILCLASAPARAQPPAVAPVPPEVRRTLSLVVAADPDAAGRFLTTTRDLLGSLPITLHTQTRPFDPAEVLSSARTGRASGNAAVHAWVELRADRAPALFLVDLATGRVLLRRLQASPSPATTREALAQIVHAGVEAVLEGAAIGVPHEQATADLEPPATGPRRAPGVVLSLGLSLGYEAQAMGSRAPLLHGPTVAARIRRALEGTAVTAYLGAQARVRWPTRVEGDPVALELALFAVTAVAGVERALTTRWTVDAALGLSAEGLYVRPRPAGAGVAVADPRWLVRPVGRLAVGVLRRTEGRLAFGGGVALDLDLSETRLVAEQGSQIVTLLRPWTLRPGFALTAAWF